MSQQLELWPTPISNADLDAIGKSALNFVVWGEDYPEPHDLCGLEVYAVIGALREDDGFLHGSNRRGQRFLTPEQAGRLEAVETAVDQAVAVGRQYLYFVDESQSS